MIDIYTDGGCSGNPGPGAWAYVINACGKEIEASGYSEATTNNRMELTAVIKALEALEVVKEFCKDGDVRIYTDSQYVRKGITEWIKRWEINGWKNSKKEPVKNIDLWKELKKRSESINPTWVWVQGHSGNNLNEKCDRIVKEKIREGKKV